MTRGKPRSETRGERVELRASSRQTTMIKQAAEATGKTVTAFVLDAAYLEAQRALTDRRLFLLDAKDWSRFTRALDRPAKSRPRLRKLMEQPSILD
jgi:uncharacterized protein (DUF1778 family)